jgi:hypothetical protein
MPRNDLHRPGAIVPANYRPVHWYHLTTTEGGWPVPAFGVNCAIDKRREIKDSDGKVVQIVNGEHAPNGRCCVIGFIHIAKVTWGGNGGTGKCSVCGAAFGEGQIWEHIPTGEHIHVGHQCADKYELLADWSAEELAYGRFRQARAIEITRLQNAKEREDFLAKWPGLDQALKTNHRIVADIASRFQSYRTLSDKQVALVFKLAAEANAPKLPDTRPPSNHLGTIGERLTLTVTVEFIKRIDHGDFDPPTYLHVMTDEQGNDLRWFSSAGALCEKGTKITIRGTVKKHEVYQGRKQTMLSRCVEYVPPAPKAKKGKGKKAEPVVQAEDEAPKVDF